MVDVSINQAGFPIETAVIKSSPLVIDLDNDGDLEIILGDNNGFVRMYQIDGSEIIDDTFPFKLEIQPIAWSGSAGDTSGGAGGVLPTGAVTFVYKGVK